MTVKQGERLGPGPNRWRADNVRVDDRGRLHLRIARRDGAWTCAEVASKRLFGLGTYRFEVEGRLDQLDPNVVLGLFSYPPPAAGPDGTHEIDIELAHWGNPKFPIGNFTVWPTRKGPKPTSHTFAFEQTGSFTTHRYVRSADQVRFLSQHGHRDDLEQPIAAWTFRPERPVDAVSTRPMPVLLNLWLFQGKPPTDDREVEVIIKSFTFTPDGPAWPRSPRPEGDARPLHNPR